MKNKITLLVIIVALVALIVGASVLYDRLGQQAAPDQLVNLPSSSTGPTEPAKPTGSAPDFTVYDADGNPVHLSDFFGKPIVLNFWASWCGPCQAEMPHFQEVYEELGDEVVFLMVNVTGEGNDSKSAAQAFIQNNNYTFPVLFDMDLDATYAYGVNGFPMTFFINANGDPMLYAPGAITEATLRDAIEKIR